MTPSGNNIIALRKQTDTTGFGCDSSCYIQKLDGDRVDFNRKVTETSKVVTHMHFLHSDLQKKLQTYSMSVVIPVFPHRGKPICRGLSRD